MRRQFRAVEKARASPVEIKEVTVVDPFEVEQERDRLAQASIGEHRTAGVEDVVAARLRHAGGQRLLDHTAVTHGGKNARRLPATPIVLLSRGAKAAPERPLM